MQVVICDAKQKALSRKQKGSANRKKARIRLAALHERVANARADFQHKLSRAIVDENQAVIVETLKTANMMKNHNLARAIGDAGWHSFITKLEYKTATKGVHLVKLDPAAVRFAIESMDAPFISKYHNHN
ncbi:RNA-guided endonuclease InsQ/TnpB family protein [Salmonella enterica]|uniref:RNA-guided endonuclease InsQ/TnpB family protein n=1 Tax=Salmonella enterica TaxID=28901 RepID=UPI001FAF1F16|nr:transposase [Salmonella enterica]